MKKFWTLMKKDWRLNRAAIIGLLVVMVLSYGIWSSVYEWDNRPGILGRPMHPARFDPAPEELDLGSPLSSYIRFAAMMGISFVVLAAAVFGAAAFAFERKERAAEFLAMLPVKRSRIIASKLLAAFAVLGSAMAIELWVLLYSDMGQQWKMLPDLLRSTWDYVASGIVAFGIAWIFSTFMNSAAIATSLTILAVAGISLALNLLLQLFLARAIVIPMPLIMCFLCGIGVFGVAAGSIYYMRRVAP